MLLHLCFLHVIDIVVINSDWFLGYFVGNTLWLVAIGYYLYITFLGYNGKFYSYRILLRNVKTNTTVNLPFLDMYFHIGV